MPPAVAEANGIVEAFARDVDAVVVGENACVDVRMRAEEPSQARQQPTGRERSNGAYGHHFAKPSIFELIERGPDAAEGFGQHGHQGLTLVGQREPPRKSAEQGYTQNFLKALDLMADGSLGHTQLQAGPRKAEMTGGCLERMQRGERQVRSDHCIQPQIFLMARPIYHRLSILLFTVHRRPATRGGADDHETSICARCGRGHCRVRLRRRAGPGPRRRRSVRKACSRPHEN
jgi:hypothetical protein